MKWKLFFFQELYLLLLSSIIKYMGILFFIHDEATKWNKLREDNSSAYLCPLIEFGFSLKRWETKIRRRDEIQIGIVIDPNLPD